MNTSRRMTKPYITVDNGTASGKNTFPALGKIFHLIILVDKGHVDRNTYLKLPLISLAVKLPDGS